MAFFKFSATDSSGQVVSGTLQADSDSQVRELLSRQGLNPQWVGTNNPPVAATQTRSAPTARPASGPRPDMRPSAQTRPASPSQAPVKQAPAAPPDQFKRTIKPKNAGFLFEQMASMVRAGVGMQQILLTLSSQNPDANVKRALYEMASRVTEGRSLADAMALHPDVFNPDMVGTIRAGEMGGFLPDALQELAGSAMLAHHLSRGFMWITACVLIAIFTTPGVLAIIKGSLRSMELQDQAGGSLPTMTTLQNAVGAQLQWSLPMSIALVLLTLLLHRLWMHRRLRAVRHQMSLVVPLLSNRAKAEAARRFSFALGGITRAGVPPQTAYELASEAIPNDILRESMLRRLTTANESTKLSDLIRGSGILNYQYEHMIQNGELTGDVPGMLGSIATAEGANSETANVTAKRVLNVVAMFLFAIFIVIATGILYRFLYDGIFKVVLKDS